MIHVCAEEAAVAATIIASVAPFCRAAWYRICQFCGRVK